MRLTERDENGKADSIKQETGNMSIYLQEVFDKLADYEDTEERHTMKIELTDEEYKGLMSLVKAGICQEHFKCPCYDCAVCHEKNPLYAKLKAREGKE